MGDWYKASLTILEGPTNLPLCINKNSVFSIFTDLAIIIIVVVVVATIII